MLAIHKDQSAGDCSLHGKINVGTDDDSSLTFPVCLRFTLDSTEDAKTWEGSPELPIFPGLPKMFEAVQAEGFDYKWPALRWVPVGGLTTTFTLVPRRGTEQGAGGIERRPCVIQSAVARVTGQATWVDVKVKFSGVTDDEIEDFMALLRGTLHAEMDSGQQDMFGEAA